MAKNGLFDFLKKVNDKEKEHRDKESENYINTNPTEDQLKDNKNAKKAWTMFILSLIFGLASIFVMFIILSEWGIAGIFFIPILCIGPLIHKKTIKYAKAQRRTNGKGTGIIITANVVFISVFTIVALVLILYYPVFKVNSIN